MAGKNSLTNKQKLVQLYSESGVRLLERFYDSLKTGQLVDPLEIVSSDVYYTWVHLRETMPGGKEITLGQVVRALHLEGHLDERTGMFWRPDEEEDESPGAYLEVDLMLRGSLEKDESPGAPDGLAATVPVSAELDADP